MRRYLPACGAVFLLMLTGCAALYPPRDPVTNRVYQKQYYDYYDSDHERERVSAQNTDHYDNSDYISDTLDRLRNEKPKHNSAGWKYQPPR